ncbi:hypothetical protein [Robiginitomaculum antarcticum]|uniref:hypothetical protein n=1 Tax=Robiginitomaculum antarcticum TaxID=437507 RepID=UPI00037228C4|nr:hypothetical protein [Robiginitomaculum antarcticum]
MISKAIKYNKAVGPLAHVYLEDSYVLDIITTSADVSFIMEFVLCEGHEFYQSPKRDEQHCYLKGVLKFSSCSSIQDDRSNSHRSIDANYEEDMGNIDSFIVSEGACYLAGDWGRISVKCEDVSVNFHDVESDL